MERVSLCRLEGHKHVVMPMLSSITMTTTTKHPTLILILTQSSVIHIQMGWKTIFIVMGRSRSSQLWKEKVWVHNNSLSYPFFWNIPSHSTSGDRGSQITLVGLVCNIGLTAAKGAAGWSLHSASLLADAGHSLSGKSTVNHNNTSRIHTRLRSKISLETL